MNGRINNLDYGSYAPGAPDVFLDDAQWKQMWLGADRVYIVAEAEQLPRFQNLAGADRVHTVIESGGKVLLTNQPI